jgi:spore cortex biosynthesis protein YabQ
MQLLVIQSYTFILMFIFGVTLGVSFDVYRFLLKYIKLYKMWINIIDFCFWILEASIAFFVLVFANWGELRFYVFLAILIGFYLYFIFRRFLFSIIRRTD